MSDIVALKHKLYVSMTKPCEEVDEKVFTPILRTAFNIATPIIEQHLSKKVKVDTNALNETFWNRIFEQHLPQLLKEANVAVEEEFTTKVLDLLDTKQLDAIHSLATGQKFDNGPEMQAASVRVAALRKTLEAEKQIAAVVRSAIPQFVEISKKTCQEFDPDADIEDK